MVVMEKPPIGAMPKRKSRWGIPFLVLIALVVVAYIGYQAFAVGHLSRQLPEGSTSISFSDTGVLETFLLSDFSLLAQPRIRVGDAIILESQDLPTAGEKAVLATVPNTYGTVLGVVHGNGNFEPKLSDGTMKTDLRVVGANRVVYTVSSRPVVWEDSTALVLVDDEANVIEGSATGPVDTGVDYTGIADRKSIPGGMLYSFDLTSDTVPQNLGTGKSPRVTTSGFLVALSPEGIVRIDATTAARKVMLAFEGGDAVGSTISSDGTVALLHSEGNSISSAYALTKDTATLIGSIVSLVPTYGATFADDTHIFLRTDRKSVALYLIPDDIAALKPPTAHLSIIAPQ